MKSQKVKPVKNPGVCKFCNQRIISGSSSGTNDIEAYDYHLDCRYKKK